MSDSNAFSAIRSAMSERTGAATPKSLFLPLPKIGPELHEVVLEAHESGYFVVSVVGNNPINGAHSPRQPYTYQPESLAAQTMAIESHLTDMLEQYPKLLVIARCDQPSLDFAALRIADQLANKTKAAGLYDQFPIMIQPVETFRTGSRPFQDDNLETERQLMLLNNPDATSGCFLPPIYAHEDYASKEDWRALEVALAAEADFCFCAYNDNRVTLEFDKRLQALCAETGQSIRQRLRNLHLEVTGEKKMGATHTRNPEISAVYAGFGGTTKTVAPPNPGHNRFEGDKDTEELANIDKVQKAKQLLEQGLALDDLSPEMQRLLAEDEVTPEDATVLQAAAASALPPTAEKGKGRKKKK